MSFVRPISSSIPNSQKWRGMVVEAAETPDMDMVVVEAAAVEVRNSLVSLEILANNYRWFPRRWPNRFE